MMFPFRDQAIVVLVVDLAATVCAGSLLTLAGLRLRRYVAARDRHRPIAEPLGREWLRSSRPARLRQFEGMAVSLLRDVGTAVIEGPQRTPEARALLPIVVEVKRHGENLLRRRGRLTFLLAPALERRLEPLVEDLARVEDLLRTLPRPALTLEDVLAGRFAPPPHPQDPGILAVGEGPRGTPHPAVPPGS